jgi:malonyl-CoA/methylmalonyl-CoA synthetase
MITSNPLHGVRKPGSVGVPLPGVDVRLVDPEHFGAAPDGEVGEIWVRGANVFIGYLGKPEATAEAFVDGWFRTGDLARRGFDGYYQIVGRRSDLIITGGLNVYPAEVEAVLNEIEGVDESAVIGLPDDDLGERVTAIVVPEKARADLTPSSITAAARARLAPYKCPRQVQIVDSLPRNAMGKIEKAELRRAFASSS